jgi:hypothetical protein
MNYQKHNKFTNYKTKENSSYNNDKTNDTTLPRQNTQAKIQNHLYNFVKDSKDLKISRDYNTGAASYSGMHGRTQSSKNLNCSYSAAKIRAYSPAISILKGKSTLNESRSKEIIRATSKSFDDNGKQILFNFI